MKTQLVRYERCERCKQLKYIRLVHYKLPLRRLCLKCWAFLLYGDVKTARDKTKT